MKELRRKKMTMLKCNYDDSDNDGNNVEKMIILMSKNDGDDVEG